MNRKALGFFAAVVACVTGFAEEQARFFDLEKSFRGSDDPFAVIAPDGWTRVDRFEVSFDYHTEAAEGEVLALTMNGIYADGKRQPVMHIVTKPTGGSGVSLFASDDVKHIDAEFVVPPEETPKYRINWERRAAKSGKIHITNLTVNPVMVKHHILVSDKMPLTGTKAFFLSGVEFASKSKRKVLFAYPEKNPECKVAVKNELGETLFTVEGKNGVAEIDLPMPGYWEFEASAVYPDGSKIVSFSRVANLGEPISDEDLANSRYGLMFVNFNSRTLGRPLGVRWDQGAFFMDKDDPHYHQQSFKLPYPGANNVFSLFGCAVPRALRKPEFRNRQGWYPPADWDKCREFVRNWLREHPELDGHRICQCGELDFAWCGTRPEFVKMCKMLSEEVRDHYKNVEISGPMCSRIKVPYLTELYDLGYFSSIDVVNLHHYVDGSRPEDEFLDLLFDYDKFKKERHIDKPTYITEVGWTSDEGGFFVPVSEVNHARYLTRAMALMSSFDIKAIIWHVDFCFRRTWKEPCGFSLIGQFNDSLYAKPALAAFATVTRNLTDVEGCMKLRRLGPETFIVSGLRRRGEAVHVLWRTSGTEEMAMPVVAERAETYLGTPIRVGEKVLVSESPVYIFGPNLAINAPEWKPSPEDMVKKVPAGITTVGSIARVDNSNYNIRSGSALDKNAWSEPERAPDVCMAWNSGGLMFDFLITNGQPQSVSFGFDLDKANEWEANEIHMSFKGHRCVEYLLSADQKVKGITFRRNSWIPDMGSNMNVGSYVRNGPNKVKNGMHYWIKFPWASLGLGGTLKPGSVIGISMTLGDPDQEGAVKLGGGLSAPIDPMKYVAFELK